MAYRLLNSASDPQRIIRSLRLNRDLQRGLESGLNRIWNADTVIGLTHAHGRALGLGVGLGLLHAVTPEQFNLLSEAYTRAFEHRLAVLAEQGLYQDEVNCGERTAY
ncbi:hypothetical protein EC919_11543 [Pseudomonas graminis]|uniref:hypothetical protein n=1 Tax=Pseudomonas graminis TaxID=158627 RepID=UPI00105B89CB|nr:hypothetical protein [Pseudomonas graminis]TDV43796.1 hypothetical protein EC919_11543 [Pseudomonas graminis]